MPVVVEQVSVETIPDTSGGADGAAAGPQSGQPARTEQSRVQELRRHTAKLREREERVRAH